jgi:hypothetical protein
MSRSGLQAIIGAAAADSAFCRQLLESPADIVDEFALNPLEREALLAIHAESLADLTTQLNAWLEANQDRAHSRKNGDNKKPKQWVLLR